MDFVRDETVTDRLMIINYDSLVARSFNEMPFHFQQRDLSGGEEAEEHPRNDDQNRTALCESGPEMLARNGRNRHVISETVSDSISGADSFV